MTGRLHVLTDAREGRAPLAVAEAALSAGAPVVQVRAKGVTDRELYDFATRVAALCARYGGSCLVDDRVDVALAVGAAGTHLGAHDLPLAAARQVAGADHVLGGTAREPVLAASLVADGADYLGVGPAYATSTKDGLPDPLGPSGVGLVARAVEVPVIAIGGITVERVPELLAAGAHGVAVVGAVSDAADPAAAVRALLAALGVAVTRVVVAGGGLIGLSVAWRAAQAGLSVTVVDEDPGSGASRAAAGMLAPVTEAAYGEEALLALARASLEHFPAFVREVEQASGREVGLRTAGTLVVGFDEDDMAALQALHAFQRELGLAAERLTPRACRSREPGLTPRLRGGLLVPGDHSVEPRALHAALLVAAQRAGVDVLRARVDGLLVEDGRCTGVSAGGQALPADQVVLALGALSGRLPGVPAGTVPVRPVKGQILRLRGEPVVEGTVRALVRGRSVYLVPASDGRLVVGATMEELGFDPRVTAGAVLDLLRDAAEVVPGITELELVETLARFRPGTPDNAPLLGRSTLPGLVLATGHHRNGVLLTPVTSDALRDVLVEGELPAVARPFSADRFVRGGGVELTVNGERSELPDGATVSELVRLRAQDARRVAVARNGEVVPRSAWERTRLESGDAVEVLAAVAGG